MLKNQIIDRRVEDSSTTSARVRTLVVLVLECIQEAGEQGIPSGHLFAMMMTQGLNHDSYQMIIDSLVELELIECKGFLLKATGKELSSIAAEAAEVKPIELTSANEVLPVRYCYHADEICGECWDRLLSSGQDEFVPKTMTGRV